jgi:hypothetical protein
MNYRYFYNTTGDIVGFASYKSVCLFVEQSDSQGHIDSQDKVDISQYKVDLTTLTLVSISD